MRPSSRAPTGPRARRPASRAACGTAGSSSRCSTRVSRAGRRTRRSSPGTGSPSNSSGAPTAPTPGAATSRAATSRSGVTAGKHHVVPRSQDSVTAATMVTAITSTRVATPLNETRLLGDLTKSGTGCLQSGEPTHVLRRSEEWSWTNRGSVSVVRLRGRVPTGSSTIQSRPWCALIAGPPTAASRWSPPHSLRRCLCHRTRRDREHRLDEAQRARTSGRHRSWRWLIA